MKAFVDRLIDQITAKKSHVVVGLDPTHENLPTPLLAQTSEDLEGISVAIVEFNKRIIDAVYDLVPAIKPQIAFYERYGIRGVEAFLKTVEYGKEKGLIVIEDAKRNDISSTAKAYSEGHIGKVMLGRREIAAFDVDAITVNPFLGSDGVVPFLDSVIKNQKGIFVLVKTSNPSSIEIQDLPVRYLDKEFRLYEVVASLVNEWGKSSIGSYGYSSVGAVVGATFPEDIKILRRLMPNTYFLVPGYGAQGGSAQQVIHCFNQDGLGAIISASRSIIYAYKGSQVYTQSQYGEAARDAVIEMNREINKEMESASLLNW
jgi:orotidine-5'-phosphate decarboxylase